MYIGRAFKIVRFSLRRRYREIFHFSAVKGRNLFRQIFARKRKLLTCCCILFWQILLFTFLNKTIFASVFTPFGTFFVDLWYSFLLLLL